MSDKILKKTKNLQFAKFYDIKILKSVHWPRNFCVTYTQTLGFLTPEAEENMNIDKKCQKEWKKIASFGDVLLKFVMLKS